MEKPDVLYHYCSVDSFFHIIRSRKIWLSSIYNMNDSTDGSWPYYVLEKMSEEDLYDADRLTMDERRRKRNLLLLSNHYQTYHSMYSLYTFSLSEMNDQLSQWRSYGDDGAGVAIGFKTEDAFFSNTIATATENLIKKTPLCKISYKSFDKVFKEINEHYTESDDPDVTIFNANNKLQQYLIQSSYQLKNAAFEEEKEWRFIIRGQNNNVFPPLDNTGFVMPSFRCSHKSIVAYYEIEMDKLLNTGNVINEIVLGPKSRIEETDLKMFLDNLEYRGVRIYRSKATYR